MQSIFFELVKLSLIGSLFAAAVMLVRLVFRKAPKWLFCILWGVGNHGGGPSRKDLADSEALKAEGSLEILHSTPEIFFERIV